MKIVLDIKPGSKSTNFKKGDMILYDGLKWYVVTKDELMREFEIRHNNAISFYDEKYRELEQKFNEFLREYTEQNSKLLPILEELMRKD